MIERGDKGMVLRDVEVRNAGLEEGQLEIAHLLPIDDLGVEIEPQSIDEALDVADGDIAVPAAVDVEDQRSETEFLDHEVQHERAVEPSGHAEDRVELLALALFLDPGDGAFNLSATTLVRVPVWRDVGPEAQAMIANALVIE